MKYVTKLLMMSCLASVNACMQPTPGQLTTFRLAIATSWPPNLPIHTVATNTGWTVTFEQAAIVLGPIYFWELGPLSANSALVQRPWWTRLTDAVLPTAWAHPGDSQFSGGAVRGEFIDQVVYDVLSKEPLELGAANGVEGEVRSFTITLDPPDLDFIVAGHEQALHGFHAYVVGMATKGDTVVPFEGGLVIPNKGRLRMAEGLATSFELDGNARVVVSVNISSWFAEADFSTLTEVNEQGRYLITPQSQVGSVAWYLGVRDYDSFFAERL